MSDATIATPPHDAETEEGIAAVKMTTRFNLAEALQQASKETKRSPFSLSLDFAKASLGKAKLTQDEFFRYRIYDKANLSAEERDAFVGQPAINAMNLSMNQSVTCNNIVDQKVLYCAALRALGLNAPVLQAMVANSERETAYKVLRGASEFAAFLRSEARYPLFGKPNNGSLSQGAVSFDRYDATADKLIDVKGDEVDVDAFAAEAVANFGGGGYVIEDRVIPHPELQEVSGQTVGTIRILTLDEGKGPQTIYAVWKIPSFNAVADNLWRTGNLAAEIDMESGEVLGVRSSGVDGETMYDTHPESGAQLIGRIMPDWEAAKSVVRRAAALTPHIPTIGFDLALSDQGPVIIEGNTVPNHGLYQAATGRGFLSPEMREKVKRVTAYSQWQLDSQLEAKKENSRDYKQRKQATSKSNFSEGMKTALNQPTKSG